MTKTPRNDFEALIRRAGLPLSPAQMRQIYETWALVEPMLDRIRIRSQGRDLPAEPAHIFRADAYAQTSSKKDAS